MTEEKTYSIGDFSQKTGVPIRTLHYYDEIGLLKPRKHPVSGHRMYNEKDVLDLHKIVSLKFLGCSLEQIKELIAHAEFDVSLNKTLLARKQALTEEKERIEQSLQAIDRTMLLLEKEGAVDSHVLMSLINNMQTEKTQREWLEAKTPKEIVDRLFNKSEEEKIELDIAFIQLTKEVKRLMGRPASDPEVLALVEQFMQATIEFVGEDAMYAMGEMDTSEAEELAAKVPSPYTKEEEAWLNAAMEYYMVHNGMMDPETPADPS
ncbi:MerR family transcriptional regulator [Paenibacillus ginsengihumi]|uniref:MerR family transcriptional regulator n=1 Tax=Paenibacillus ginsengihumi TaxID=431596 RepID=UPI00037631A6|nr:MerR family transcriptional regulator [Paenibacillus ginsengihumi]